MQPYERKQLLERIDRDGATVGASIPDAIELDGEPFDLRSFVFEVRSVDGVAPDERERVEETKKLLRRARRERRQQLEDEQRAAVLTWAEGERLVEEIVGIERALNALEDMGSTDLEAEMQAQEVADRKRWRSFLQRALGSDDDGPRRRSR